MQAKISADDKDIEKCFNKLFEISTTYLMNLYDRMKKANANLTKEVLEKWEKAYEIVLENIVDAIFGAYPTLKMDDFMEKVEKDATHLLSSAMIRSLLLAETIKAEEEGGDPSKI
jgi:hypothetical protein